MVVINRTRKDSCENARVLLLLVGLLDSHGAHSSATSARCNLGWSVTRCPQCIPLLL